MQYFHVVLQFDRNQLDKGGGMFYNNEIADGTGKIHMNCNKLFFFF